MSSPFIIVEKINGKHWFVQNGERFLALGVNVVQPADGSKVPDGKLYNVWDKYDGDVNVWANAAIARLKNWNFNTVAGWSHDHLYDHGDMYHTRVLWMGPWGQGMDRRLMDVFSATYAEAVDQYASEHVAPHKDNTYLIGYFCNNELPWYGQYGWPGDPNVSLLTRYITLPPKAPGKIKVVEFLIEQYDDDFNAFIEEWDTTATSFDDLLAKRRISPRARHAKKLTFEWAGIVAEQYFKLCAETIRRHDPNHLFLGARFAGYAPRPVIEACGRYADVVSINLYRKTGHFDSRLTGAIAALTGKPIMITEFSWRAMENNSGCMNEKGADVTVATQQDRADAFRRYATEALEQPFLVGYDWFQYFDQPPAGRFDGENSNYGLVDIYDEPYTVLLSAIKDVNARAESLHGASEVLMPEYDPGVMVDYQDIAIRKGDGPLPRPLVWYDGYGRVGPYGDTEKDGCIQIDDSGDSRVLHVHTGTGWGCGVAVFPPEPAHPDGSADVLGADRIVVKMKASKDFRFNVGLNESGHGPTNAQTFDGYANGDGESYNHVIVEGKSGEHTYALKLADMEQNPYHGNQRGNKIIDTDAVAELSIYFPGSQGDFDIEIESITVE